jgi:hypothetical protein
MDALVLENVVLVKERRAGETHDARRAAYLEQFALD